MQSVEECAVGAALVNVDGAVVAVPAAPVEVCGAVFSVLVCEGVLQCVK